jgi:hypothetical protein
MTQAVVAMLIGAAAVALLCAMSLHANRRFGTEPRLPMQWIGRSVTWTAPRPVALAFTPVLAAVCLTAIAALGAFRVPRPGQEGLVIPLFLLVALAFLGVHALHLWLIQRTLARRR